MFWPLRDVRPCVHLQVRPVRPVKFSILEGSFGQTNCLGGSLGRHSSARCLVGMGAIPDPEVTRPTNPAGAQDADGASPPARADQSSTRSNRHAKKTGLLDIELNPRRFFHPLPGHRMRQAA